MSGPALSRRHQQILYAVTTLLWISGAVWLILHYFCQVSSEFGPQPNPAQPLWLKIHGAAAMAFLVLLGTLLPQHVRLGWWHVRQRPSGILLLSSCVFLIVTGWGLYYLGNEKYREWTSLVHWILGLLLFVFLFFHAWYARQRLGQVTPKP